MNRKLPSIRMPLLWSVVHFLIFFSLIVPGINLLTIHLMMAVILYLMMKLDLKRFLPIYAANLLLVGLASGSWAPVMLLFPLIFLPGAVVMGTLYKRKWTAYRTVVAGALTLVAEMILTLIAVRLSGHDPFEAMKTMMHQSLAGVPEKYIDLSQLDALFYTLQMTSPLVMLAIGFYYALITHGLARAFFGKQDGSIPALPPLSKWRVPRVTAIYFIVVLVASLFINQTNGSALAMIVLNLLPLLMLLLTLQALSFLAFVGKKFRWSKAIPWIALVLILIFNMGMYIAVFVGLLDLLFSLKERLTDKT
ncbi:DUF2232 domain-containing protein [Gorillibacterium sp. sgz500922]|uniref:DUF2232 domain-containing protein n=1 Tax=Gorillibacterium sp. sgz500922 TaxID=3446694 RepID=UPI003F663748